MSPDLSDLRCRKNGAQQPKETLCCCSLHAHNGELETASDLARRLIDSFDLENLDAIITNAACYGSHLKTYGHLLESDAAYHKKAAQWSAKLKDIHKFLSEIGIRQPQTTATPRRVTYHEACHGQKITMQPREVLKSILGLELVELPESAWCCGSAGIYNITQPEMAATCRNGNSKTSSPPALLPSRQPIPVVTFNLLTAPDAPAALSKSHTRFRFLPGLTGRRGK